MSWFTCESGRVEPCPRCKSPNFSVLVKRAAHHDIYDCRKCGVIETKRGGQ